MSDDSINSEDEDLLSFQPFASQDSKGSAASFIKETEGLKVEYDEKDGENNDDDAIHEALASKKVDAIILPKQLKNITTARLAWHRVKKQDYPCRKCDKEESFGLDVPQSWDENKFTLIQYIEFPAGLGPRSLVKNQSLTEYNGENSGINEWWSMKCLNYSKELKKRKSRKKTLKGSLEVILKAEIFLLKRIMNHAIENSKKNAEGQDASIHTCTSGQEAANDFMESDLDEPYTQDWGSGTNDDDDVDNIDDIYASAVTLQPSRKKEPIRPGDVISYHSHVYVSGDKRGLRTATVLSVNAKGDPVLKLSNGDYLSKDTQIKRIKIMKGGALEDHNGIFRPIVYFKLKTNLRTDSGFETEGKRLGKLLREKAKRLAETIEKEGDKSLPTDFLLHQTNDKSDGDNSKKSWKNENGQNNSFDAINIQTPSKRKRHSSIDKNADVLEHDSPESNKRNLRPSHTKAIKSQSFSSPVEKISTASCFKDKRLSAVKSYRNCSSSNVCAIDSELILSVDDTSSNDTNADRRKQNERKKLRRSPRRSQKTITSEDLHFRRLK